METGEYKNIFENEGKHFFYVANRRLVITLAKRYLGSGQTLGQLKILDAGCGTGFLAKKMEELGQVRAVDISEEALRFAHKYGIRVKKASITSLPFKANFFDLVVCIDVIYHQMVEDDSRALDEILRVLKPGGILILRVPANKWLRLAHDKYVHTRERYGKEELKSKLLKTGFIIEKLSFVGMILYPLILVRHAWEKVWPPEKVTSSIGKVPKLVNEVFSIFLSIEGWLLVKTDLPIGIGLIAVGRKPEY